MTVNPKAKGEKTEAVVLAKLLIRNEVVLQPFGDNQRYDLVIDRNGVFLRVQCKTGRIRNSCVKFNTYSTSGGGPKKSYIGEVEFFGIYCPDNDKAYLVPIHDCSEKSGLLRLYPPKNNSCISKVKWAVDYEI